MSSTTYDRTRWDRLQSTLLVGGIALVSTLPTWALVALVTGLVHR